MMKRQLTELAKEPAADVEFLCSGAEDSVQVAGSWNGWKPHNLVHHSKQDLWFLSLKLKPGCYKYKYIIDGEWIHDPSKKWKDDGEGNINNVIIVESKLDIFVVHYRMAVLRKTVHRLRQTHAEIKELKQKLGTCWYNDIESYKLNPKAGV